MTRTHATALVATVLAAVFVLPAGAQAAGCTTSWTNAGGGDWNNPGNWDSGVVPDATSDVCITLPGTYTVELDGTIANIHALTVGGASGTQTLRLAGNEGKSTNLIADATADIGANGVVVLTSLHPDHTSAFWPKGGTTSFGTIVADPGVDAGVRDLRGALTNNGTVQIGSQTVYGGGGSSDVLVNHGTVDLGARLDVTTGAVFTSASGGRLTGTDRLVLQSATFNLAAGAFPNPNPIELETSNLNVTSTVAARFLWHGVATLTGGLRSSGQKLTVEGNCAAPGSVFTGTPWTNKGTIVLTSAGCSRLAELNVGTVSNTFTNLGTLSVQPGAGGQRSVLGTLENRKTLVLQAGTTLDSFAFKQLSTASLKTFVNTLTSYGSLTSGPVTLAGTLAIARLAGFNPALGSSLAIVSGSSLTGAFAKATGAVISKTKYFLPTYSATDAQLVVTNASLAISPASGPAGTVVTLTGAGFPPGRNVALSFKDHLAAVTTYTPVTADSTGAFSAQITIPAAAATGSGTVITKSGYTGVQATKTFNVTP